MDPEVVADAALKKAIFGDYYDSPKPKTKLKAIRARFKLRDQALRTLPSNPARALNFFTRSEMTAPADDDEEAQSAMTTKFWENAHLLEAVISNQPVAKLIVQFLSPAEARRVKFETNLKRLVETTDGRRKMCVYACCVHVRVCSRFFCVFALFLSFSVENTAGGSSL